MTSHSPDSESTARPGSGRTAVEQLQRLVGVVTKISTAVTETATVEELISRVHHLLGEIVDTRNFFVALYDQASGMYRFPYYRDQHDQLEMLSDALQGSLTDYVRRSGRPLRLTAELEASLTRAGEIVGIIGTPASGWLGAPLRTAAGQVIGVVAVQSYDDPELYTEADLEILELAAGQIAVAVERKYFEQALERSNSFLGAVIEQAPFGIQICEGSSDSWRLTTINREAARILGTSGEDQQGLGIDNGAVVNRDRLTWRTLHADGRRWPLAETPLPVAMAVGLVTPNAEMVIRRADGAESTVLVTAAPIRDGAQQLIGGVATYSDITDRKRSQEERLHLERKLLHAQKLESLGVLAGGIAHDFNNLLMAILANADLALLDADPDTAMALTIREIEGAAQRASELVNQLLAYSGRGRFVVKQLSLNQAIHEMGHILEVAVSKMVELRLELATELPLIEADAAQVHQVVMNLVTNASDAIGDRSGVVTVRTAAVHLGREQLRELGIDPNVPAGRYVTLEVTDTGCGMDSSTLGRVFDPFFTTKFLGRGLGMAAVQGIVQAHGGAIAVASEPTRGTTVTVLFPPRGANPPTAAVDETEQSILAGSGAVLLVEDESTVRAVAERLLSSMGLKVLPASDGQEAVDLFSQRRADIDFVLLDLTMPRMDGLRCFRELRRIDPGVRVILSSGYSEQEVSARFAGERFAGFVQKPYTRQVLGDVLRRALRS